MSGRFTSDKYSGENLDCSPVNVISIKYTTAPLVFSTGSHFSEIEVKFLLVTAGMAGFGVKEPSPANMEEIFCNCVRNAQLSSQLLELFCNRKTTPAFSSGSTEKKKRKFQLLMLVVRYCFYMVSDKARFKKKMRCN